MTVNLLDAAATAVFQALKSNLPPELGPVFQHVPQDTKPPFFVIGEVDQESAAGKAMGLDLFAVEIQSIYSGVSRAPLLQMMGAVRAALEGTELTAPGADFETPRFVSATASSVAGDGKTYVGISNFEFYGEGD